MKRQGRDRPPDRGKTTPRIGSCQASNLPKTIDGSPASSGARLKAVVEAAAAGGDVYGVLGSVGIKPSTYHRWVSEGLPGAVLSLGALVGGGYADLNWLVCGANSGLSVRWLSEHFSRRVVVKDSLFRTWAVHAMICAYHSGELRPGVAEGFPEVARRCLYLAARDGSDFRRLKGDLSAKGFAYVSRLLDDEDESWLWFGHVDTDDYCGWVAENDIVSWVLENVAEVEIALRPEACTGPPGIRRADSVGEGDAPTRGASLAAEEDVPGYGAAEVDTALALLDRISALTADMAAEARRRPDYLDAIRVRLTEIAPIIERLESAG